MLDGGGVVVVVVRMMGVKELKRGLGPTGQLWRAMTEVNDAVEPGMGRRRCRDGIERRAKKRREGGRRIEEEHSTRGERVKSERRGRQTTGIASPDC